MSLFESITAMDVAVFLMKGSVIILLVYLISVVFRNRTASDRYLVWSVSLYLIVSLPIISSVLPGMPMELIPADVPSLSADSFADDRAHPLEDVQRSEPVTNVVDDSRSKTLSMASQKTDEPMSISVWLSSRSLGEWLVMLWLFGALVTYLRLIVGLLSVWVTAKRSTPVSDRDWNLLSLELGNEMGLKRTVKLITSPKAMTPMTWGIFQPFVLLPEQARDWSAERLRLVLIHEFSHIRRNDFVHHLVLQLICALFWFHPLVWYISKQLVSDREKACDDAVLEEGVESYVYADHLLDIARLLKNSNQSTLATVCMARRSQLEGRLLSILNKESFQQRNFSVKIASVVALMTVSIGVAAIQPMPLEQIPSNFNASNDQQTGKTVEQSETTQMESSLKAGNDTEMSRQLADLRRDVDHLKARSEKTAKPIEKSEPIIENGEIAEITSNQSTTLTAPQKTTKNNKQNWNQNQNQNWNQNLNENSNINTNTELNIETHTDKISQTVKDAMESREVKEAMRIASRYGEREGARLSESVTRELARTLSGRSPRGRTIQEDSLTIDEIIKLKRYGVTIDYIKAIKQEGYKRISLNDIIDFKRYGVTVEYIKMVRKYYPNVDADDLIDMKKYGVKESLIQAVKKSDFKYIKPDDLADFAKYGVTYDYILAIQKAGYTSISADAITDMKKYGVTPDYITSFQKLGLTVRADDMIDMRKYGVRPELMKALEDAGFKSVDVDDVIDVAKYGVTVDYIKGVREAGYKWTSLEDIVDMRKYGVTEKFIEAIRKAGYTNASAEDITDARKYGVTARYIDAIRETGYKGLSLEDLTDMRKYGATAEYIKELKAFGMTDMSGEDIADMAKYGVRPSYLRDLRKAGMKNISNEDIIDLKKYGFRPELLEAIKSYGIENPDVDDLIDAAKYGLTPRYLQNLKDAGFKTTKLETIIKMKKYGLEPEYVRKMQRLNDR